MTTVWPITLNDPWFDAMKQGTKKYEGRCNWKQAAQYQVGDMLAVSHHTDKARPSFRLAIQAIHKFDTFEQALTVLPLQDVLPGVATVQEGVEIYKRDVSLATQQAQGVLLLEMK
jgi:ASC-1-like (ASCH) protein